MQIIYLLALTLAGHARGLCVPGRLLDLGDTAYGIVRVTIRTPDSSIGSDPAIKDVLRYLFLVLIIFNDNREILNLYKVDMKLFTNSKKKKYLDFPSCLWTGHNIELC